jgi:hypothetical protein
MPPFNTPNAENLLLGKGQVLFDRFDPVTGLSTGYKHLGNVEKFEITTNDDIVEKRSSMTAAAPMLKRVNRARTVGIAMTLSEFHPDNLALALMGTSAVLVQTATAVVAEALAPATVPGSFVKLAKLGPYTGLAVKFGASVGVLGIDYVVTSAKGGVIQILPGTILTGAVTADYTPTAYTAVTGPKVVGGGNAAQINGRLMFIGDPSAGPAQLVEVWRTSISPSGALEFISDDYATMELTGTAQDDSANHAANPLYQSTFLP